MMGDKAVVPARVAKCRLLVRADIRAFGHARPLNEQGWPLPARQLQPEADHAGIVYQFEFELCAKLGRTVWSHASSGRAKKRMRPWSLMTRRRRLRSPLSRMWERSARMNARASFAMVSG